MSEPRAQGQRPCASAPPSDFVERLTELGRALRAEGFGTTARDVLDAARAFELVDDDDEQELKAALVCTLKIQPNALAAFERLFSSFWSRSAASAGPASRHNSGSRGLASPNRAQANYVEPQAAVGSLPRSSSSSRVPSGRDRLVGHRSSGTLHWDPERRRLSFGPSEGETDVNAPADAVGASSEALFRKKRFDMSELSEADRRRLQELVRRLAQRLATKKSRRLVKTRGRGQPDLRASHRAALATFGELLRLARKRRAIDRTKLVFLCDTSGSMDSYTRFLLTFVLALRRTSRKAELYAFNTELVYLTPLLSSRRNEALDSLASHVPDWSGGTRIGESLATFVRDHAARHLDGKTIVVILSDGLDRGDVTELVKALRQIQRRAKKLIWLNPLLRDPRYQPLTDGMRAALPYLDHFAALYDVESLGRLLPHLAA